MALEPGRTASAPLAPISPQKLLLITTVAVDCSAAKSRAWPLAAATTLFEPSIAPETRIPELSTVMVPVAMLVLTRRRRCCGA